MAELSGANPSPMRRSNGQLETRGPGEISYEPANRVGFERVPEVVVGKLWAERVLLGDELAASSEESITKKRSDGTYYQSIDAWWSSTLRYVELVIERNLQHIRGKTFKPVGLWQVSARIFVFPSGLSASKSRWCFRTPAGEKNKRPRSGSETDIFDALPPSIADPMRGGTVDAWRFIGNRQVEEVIVGAFSTGNRVRLLHASRTAKSKTGLLGAEWIVSTLDSPVVKVFTYP